LSRERDRKDLEELRELLGVERGRSVVPAVKHALMDRDYTLVKLRELEGRVRKACQNLMGIEFSAAGSLLVASVEHQGHRQCWLWDTVDPRPFTMEDLVKIHRDIGGF
jgi:hypothetical protein